MKSKAAPKRPSVMKSSITKAVQKGVKGGFMPKGAVKQQAVTMKKG